MVTKSTLLDEQLDRLSAFEPAPFPVISLYLNTGPDQHGRPHYDLFVRQELRGRCESFEAASSERQSFDQDVERIERYLREELKPSSNALAIFACAGAGFFEVVELEAPLEEHELYVYNQPHLFTLAKLNDQYPRYALVLADTNFARILVYGMRTLLNSGEIESDKLSRTQQGGWSQARYQRHVENMQMQHVKDVVNELDRIVRADNIAHIILSGDEVVIPLLKEQMPQHLMDKVVDILRLNMYAGAKEVLERTLETMRENDAATDAEKVNAMIGEYRRGGLAVAGPESVMRALENGQVHELFIPVSPDQIQIAKKRKTVQQVPGELDSTGMDKATAKIAAALIAKAKETAARICFVEDADLLKPVRGVGASLRYRLETKRSNENVEA